MAVKEDSLSDFIVMETKYRIPRELLAILGSSDNVTELVGRYLREVRDQTLKTIPMSWRDKVTQYAVSRVKQHIFEQYSEAPEKWASVQPMHLELVREYVSAKPTADDVFDSILVISEMRRQGARLPARYSGSIIA